MAEVFAYAVLTLFPDTKLVGSEVLDYGFSYQLVLPYPQFPLEMIEDRLLQLRMEAKVIEPKVMMPQNAASMLSYKKQGFLAEKALNSNSSLLPMIQIDEAFFICQEPYLRSTKDILFFKILKMDVKENVSTIEVAAFESKDELKKFLKSYEHASKRDSSLLGKELELFIDEGLLPRGALFHRFLKEFVVEDFKGEGFKEIYSSKPIGNLLDKINESKVFVASDDQVVGYVTCSLSEVKNEILSVLQMIEKNIKLLGLEFKASASVQKKSQIKAVWLEEALGIEVPNAEETRVDFSIKDAKGKFWKSAYLEIEEFSDKLRLKFSVISSIERLICLLIEHYAGDFPLWLVPEQVAILPVGQLAKGNAQILKNKLKDLGLRVFLDMEENGLKNKIHLAQTRKIPYLCVMGDKEVQANTLSIRTRSSHKLIEMSEEEFVAHILKKLEENFESQ